jgi:hypothetical protein
MTSKTEQVQADKADALRTLRRNLVPGDTVYTVLRKYDKRTGNKVISLLALARCDVGPHAQPELWNISGLVSRLTGWKLGNTDMTGIKKDALGMDAGFHLVYTLGRFIWPDGYPCPGERVCVWNEHGGSDAQPYGGVHPETGYVLRHRWI